MALLPVANDSSVELSSNLAQRLSAGAKVALVGLKMDALKSDTAEALLRRSGAQGGYELTLPETGQSFNLTASQARLFVPELQDSALLTLRVERGPNGEAQASVDPSETQSAARTTAISAAERLAQSSAAASLGSPSPHPSLSLSSAGQALAQAALSSLSSEATLSSMSELSQNAPGKGSPPSVAELAQNLARMLPSQGIGYERALARLTESDSLSNPTQQLARFAQISSPSSLDPAGISHGAPPMAALAQSARAMESSAAAWTGAVWPGSPVQASVGVSLSSDDAFGPEERDGWLPRQAQDQPVSWLRLRMDLPGLGGLEIWAAHIAGRTFARLKTPNAEASSYLRSLMPSFQTDLESAQVSLTISESENG